VSRVASILHDKRRPYPLTCLLCAMPGALIDLLDAGDSRTCCVDAG
jgi:hypothetical protein